MNAPDKAVEIKAAIAGAVALFAGVIGWSGIAALILLVCMALDYLTGSLAAKAHGEWSSRVAREGLWHKLGEIVALLVAALCDIALMVIFASSAAPIFGSYARRGWITLLVSLWYILTELGSILENAARLGAPIPKALIEGVGRLKKKVDQQDLIPQDETPPEPPTVLQSPEVPAVDPAPKSDPAHAPDAAAEDLPADLPPSVPVPDSDTNAGADA